MTQQQNGELQVGFRMFLNTTANVTNWNPEGTECSLVSITKLYLCYGMALNVRLLLLLLLLCSLCVRGYLAASGPATLISKI